jgi:predicted nucleic acid-binding protein
MELIISDTTTPIILAKTNHLNLLSNFVQIVYIPPAVKDELSQKNDGVKEMIERAEFIKVREVSNQTILDDVKSAKLDKGEIEAISLALETGLTYL